MLIDVLNMVTGNFAEYNTRDPETALALASLSLYGVMPKETDLHVGKHSLGFRDLAVLKSKTEARRSQGRFWRGF